MMNNSRTLLASALLGGLIAGTIDIGAAALINSTDIPTILKAIAAGLLGKASFEKGVEAEWLGLFLQLAMSIVIAAVFVVAAQRLQLLRRRWMGSGLAYGVIVFVVMNYVVLPLSAVGHIPHFTTAKFLENLLAMLLFGFIIAFFVRSKSAGDAINPKA
jgi:uncharacterized membrane protein YagU involved in acid resistance